MEIRVIEQDKNRLKFALEGAGHTFCNNLKKALNEDSNTESAAYKIDHPLLGTPFFILEKKAAGKFDTMLQNAVKNIQKANKDFLAAFKKA